MLSESSPRSTELLVEKASLLCDEFMKITAKADNVDNANDFWTNSIGVGCVLRDLAGNVLLTAAIPIRGFSTVLATELHTINE